MTSAESRQAIPPFTNSQETRGCFPKSASSDAGQGNGGREIDGIASEIDARASHKNLLDGTSSSFDRCLLFIKLKKMLVGVTGFIF